jgi:IS5 family transposase
LVGAGRQALERKEDLLAKSNLAPAGDAESLKKKFRLYGIKSRIGSLHPPRKERQKKTRLSLGLFKKPSMRY